MSTISSELKFPYVCSHCHTDIPSLLITRGITWHVCIQKKSGNGSWVRQRMAKRVIVLQLFRFLNFKFRFLKNEWSFQVFMHMCIFACTYLHMLNIFLLNFFFFFFLQFYEFFFMFYFEIKKNLHYFMDIYICYI